MQMEMERKPKPKRKFPFEKESSESKLSLSYVCNRFAGQCYGITSEEKDALEFDRMLLEEQFHQKLPKQTYYSLLYPINESDVAQSMACIPNCQKELKRIPQAVVAEIQKFAGPFPTLNVSKKLQKPWTLPDAVIRRYLDEHFPGCRNSSEATSVAC